MPNQKANPHIGTADVLEMVIEEKIEIVCEISKLESVIVAIKAVHPYETMIIHIYPVYQIGVKNSSKH